VEDGFGVGAVGVAVTGLDECRAEVGGIEDFAIEDDESRTVFIGPRLMTAGDIDNSEAAESDGAQGSW